MAFLVVARVTVGEWLSLVEHLVRDQGVGGSNPLSPTKFFKQLERVQHSEFWVQRVQQTQKVCTQALPFPPSAGGTERPL
jgi:hypothetical protein